MISQRQIGTAFPLIVLVLCVASCGEQSSGGKPSTINYSTPVAIPRDPAATVMRTQECGRPIAKVRQSVGSDKIVLGIAHPISAEKEVKVPVTATETKQGMTFYPTGFDVPPTPYISIDGKIAADSTIADRESLELYSLDNGPYKVTLLVNQVCPGYSWKQIEAVSSHARVVVFMTQLPLTKGFLKTPLVMATTCVRSANSC